jgi:TatD DNase family protein
MMIDTHAHLYSSKFAGDREEMIDRARKAGVIHAYLPNIDSTSIEPMLELEAAYPDFCSAMMGLHPCSVNENYKEELDLVAEWLGRRPFVAVGEIGIDLHWDKSTLDIQIKAFTIQLKWAMQLGIPVSIHAREANEECLKVVESLQDGRLSGVFHCFSGTSEQASRMVAAGFYLGIGGVITFKNGGLDTVLGSIPLEKLVLETDAPYLAPNPYRGKRNESAYLLPIASKIADLMHVRLEQVTTTTTETARNIFAKQSNPLTFVAK